VAAKGLLQDVGTLASILLENLGIFLQKETEAAAIYSILDAIVL